MSICSCLIRNFRSCHQAVKYDQWMQAQRSTDVGSRYAGLAGNGWFELVAQKLVEASRHGPNCFDRPFYVKANRFDLAFIEVGFTPNSPLWQSCQSDAVSEHIHTCPARTLLHVRHHEELE